MVKDSNGPMNLKSVQNCFGQNVTNKKKYYLSKCYDNEKWCIPNCWIYFCDEAPSILFYSIFSIIYSQYKVKSIGTRLLGSSHYILPEKVQCSHFGLTKHFLLISIFRCHGTKLTHLVFLQVFIELIIDGNYFFTLCTLKLCRLFQLFLVVGCYCIFDYI